MFNNTELNKQYARINTLVEQAKELPTDDELRSHLTKYICVLCSGFIENSIYHAFADIAQKSCNPSVALTYAKSQLKKMQNMNSEKIRGLAKSFNPAWHNLIRDYLQEKDRGEGINSILKNRHSIAHGKDSDITIGELEDYLNRTVEVIQFIENRLIT